MYSAQTFQLLAMQISYAAPFRVHGCGKACMVCSFIPYRLLQSPIAVWSPGPVAEGAAGSVCVCLGMALLLGLVTQPWSTRVLCFLSAVSDDAIVPAVTRALLSHSARFSILEKKP